LFDGDPHFNNVVGFAPWGLPTISSKWVTYSYTGNANNTMKSPYGRASTIYYDGSGDYITYTSDSRFAFGTGDFTVEAWVYPNQAPPGGGVNYDSCIFGHFGTPACFFFLTNSNYAPAMWDGTSQHTGSIVIQPFVWSHVAWSRRLGTLSIFVNGQLCWRASNTVDFSNNTAFFTGGYGTGANRYFKGYLGLRITKGIGRYQDSFVPPQSLLQHGVPSINRRVPVALPEVARPAVLRRRTEFGGDPHFNNVTLLLPLRSHLKNVACYTRTINVNGQTAIKNDAAYLDGSDDWITTDISADISPSGTWTAECWYFANSIANDPYLIGGYSSSNTRWALQLNHTSTTLLQLFVANGGQFATADITVSSPITGWNHLAVCRSALNSKARIYHNGVLVYDNTPTYDFSTSNHSIELAAAAFNSSNELNGYLRDVRFTKGIARYSSNFIPPTSLPTHGVAALRPALPTPLPSAAARPPVVVKGNDNGGDPHFNNVVLQIPLRSHLRDESKAPKTVTVNGDTKIVNGAAYFDGTGDYLTAPSSADFNFGTGDFTVEFWLYQTSTKNTQLIDMRPTSTQGWYVAWSIGLDGSHTYYINSSNRINGPAGTFGLNQWYHVAITRAAASTKIFVNGAQSGSTWTDSTAFSEGRVLLGANSIDIATYTFPGYLKDLRITKGVARYTSNFTPPTRLPIHGVSPPYGLE
jgi:hypothetical protein